MNFFIRGLLTIKEKKGRSIILLLVMLAVCITMITSFGIQSGADAAAVLARQKLGAEVTVSQNMENMINKQRESSSSTSEDGKPERIEMNKESVPLDYIDILSESGYVKGYLASISTSANLTDLLAVGADDEDDETTTTDEIDSNQDQGMGQNMPGGDMGSGKEFVSRGDVTLSGINDFTMTSSYQNGDLELTDGSYITEDNLDENVVMVEETFAEENDLEVGDKFTIENVTLDDSDESATTIELEVIGIYKSSETVDTMGFNDTSKLTYNTLYVPYTVVATINGETDVTAVDSLTFYLNDPANVDAFVEYGENSSIDLETFTLDANNQAYEQMMEPINNVAKFAKITTIVVTIFGGLILALIIMLSIKDRINEIGMLMALGERRIKIILQFMVEALVILVIAIGIAIGSGNAISNKIGDVLLENEITQEESDSNSNNKKAMQGGPGGGRMNSSRDGFNKNAQSESIDEINVDISMSDMLDMAGLSIFVVMLATIIPSIMIMRYNPKKILSKHN